MHMYEIVGIDAGNNEVKVAHKDGVFKFASAIGEYRDRNIVSQHGDDDMIFEYNGRRGFAGTLALIESEFAGAIMGDSKAHEDAKLRILLALHRLKCPRNTFRIVVGQPIGKHTATEKDAIKRMLIGTHLLTVNSVRKLIVIDRVEVAAEGGVAFWSAPRNGLVRIIDVGSATINCATLMNKRYVDRDSFTLPFGFNTIKTRDLNELARGIYTHTSAKWSPHDDVFTVGGIARELIEPLRKYYPRIKVLNDRPLYANALGMYAIGRALYDNTQVGSV